MGGYKRIERDNSFTREFLLKRIILMNHILDPISENLLSEGN
jgi:hypothetical protein